MTYKLEIIRREEQSTSDWSGGTTTQLAIYPKDSEYKMRNFLWRLSSARVDIEESTFTNLPGIWRHIMIIEGEMKLLHEGQHDILLKPYEQDSFSGDWVTKSFGCARDFNLMLGKGCKGRLEALIIDKAVNINIGRDISDTDFSNLSNAFYCAAGEATIKIDNKDAYTLHEGDLMMITSGESNWHESISLNCASLKNAAVIRASILY